MAAQPTHGDFRAGLFTDRAEAADVAKEHADIDGTSVHVAEVRVAGELPGEVGGEELLELALAQALFLRKRCHPCREQVDVKRLGDEVVRSEPNAADGGIDDPLTGDDEHRRLLELTAAGQLFEHFESGEFGHLQVEEKKVVVAGGDFPEGGFSIFHSGDMVTHSVRTSVRLSRFWGSSSATTMEAVRVSGAMRN